MYLLLTKKGPLFLADTTVNFNPTAQELADITLMVAKEVRNFNIMPRIAMLSYIQFWQQRFAGSKAGCRGNRNCETTQPIVNCDGEMQAWHAI